MDCYTATEQAYKNGMLDAESKIVHCHDCGYRWMDEEERKLEENPDCEKMCFKLNMMTKPNFYCGYGFKND